MRAKEEKLTYSQQMRFSGEQWSALRKVAARMRVTGRAKAQREINRLFMAFFGYIDDPIASMTMAVMISEREREKGEERLAGA
ncbi:MAG: hypothetical protein J6W80_05100 [Kiritimatiellae bacterium]|nr:hypothetical protein [Kiritimatiellia bacterium]